MNRVLDFLLLVARITAGQLIGVLGVFFLFGLLLYFLSKATRNIFNNAYYPRLDIYVTGWVGTPVHELGHAAFCVLFGHRITGMKLFAPNSRDGSLGYVEHTYNAKSFYQSIGNFFIGAGPIIFGTVILYALMSFLLPNHREVAGLLSDPAIGRITMANILDNSSVMLTFSGALAAAVFSASNISSIGFWAFLYVALCVSSHMALSPQDMKGMAKGLLLMVILLFLVNVIPALLELDITPYVLKLRAYTAGFMSIFIFAALMSLLNFFVSYVVLSVLYVKKYRSLLSIIS